MQASALQVGQKRVADAHSPTRPAALARLLPLPHTQATLEKVLAYHVVPGAKFLPAGFTDGKAVATLDKGSDLTLSTKE